MTQRIERIEGDVMPVNAFVVHGPSGIVVVDAMLTLSDARKVRQAIDKSGQSLAGVLITHPHPDHYAGLAHIVGDDEVPVIATAAVDAVIRRDDAEKDAVVGPMMGEEWPTNRLFPTRTVDDGAEVELAGLTFRVLDLGPGESHADSIWQLGGSTVFAGDVAYHGMHAYLADGRWRDWLTLLDRLERELPEDATLHVGHGPAGGLELLAEQRRYVETFAAAIERHADAIAAGDHEPVLAEMRSVLASEDLLFLLDLSIEPALETLRKAS